ncbi:hypothetical protein [Candidatus Solirubrobacter pratensis]|uniref:hypothetical protein n=1 Tax=Candidatus Solirubrobacter pratensis TaxID=1298857 RepID=UPI0004827636|nr:hypothetical protein [Candidatus Solirubrobacter pratensis]
MGDAGFDAAVVSEHEHRIDAERWLAQAHGAPEPVREALRAEASGGAETGLRARFAGDALEITQTWAVVGGVKAAR